MTKTPQPIPDEATARVIGPLCSLSSTAGKAANELRINGSKECVRWAMRGLRNDLLAAKAAVDEWIATNDPPPKAIPTADDYRLARKIRSAQRAERKIA